MKFDYYDPTCPRCKEKDIPSPTITQTYYLYHCNKCHQFFRVSMLDAEISLITDKCPKCGKKTLLYERSRHLGFVSYDYFSCKKCGAMEFHFQQETPR